MTLQKLKTETALRKSAKPQHSKQSRARKSEPQKIGMLVVYPDLQSSSAMF